MKLHITIFTGLILLFGSQLKAQKPWLPTSIYGENHYSLDKALPDTLWNGFESYLPTLFQSPNGGYMNGVNGYQDKAKGQEFRVDTSYTLTHVIFWCATKTVSSSNKYVYFSIVNKDVPQLIANISILVPGSELYRDSILLSDVNASLEFQDGLNIITLPQPIVVTGNYVCVMDFSALAPGDSITLFSSSIDEVKFPGRSWEKQVNDKWYTIAFAWDLNVDFAVFPVIDKENMGIDTPYESTPIHSILFPNPCQSQTHLKVDLNIPGTLKYFILDSYGKKLQQYQSGFLSPGLHQFPISTSGLPAGTYFIGVELNGSQRSFKTLIVN